MCVPPAAEDGEPRMPDETGPAAPADAGAQGPSAEVSPEGDTPF